MMTLHIEHPIHDLGTWLRAFGRFGEARQKAGVRALRVYQPVDDDQYILVDLDFDGRAEAERFRQFLETNVWSSEATSPGLAGPPQARILVRIETESRSAPREAQ